jgi:hypothetical protein
MLWKAFLRVFLEVTSDCRCVGVGDKVKLKVSVI